MSQARLGGQPPTLRFGEFELDPSRGVLSARGQIIKLQPQPFTVLLVLLDNAPNLVTREQLGSAVWGGDVFVDLDQSLNYCIRQVRLALDDSASKPRFIDTLPKQGYRFIFPVSRHFPSVMLPENLDNETTAHGSAISADAGLPHVSSGTVESNVSVTKNVLSRRTFALLAGGTLGAIGAGAWIGELTHRRKRPEAIQVVLPLPDQTVAADPSRLLGPPAISPDGRVVVVSLLKGTNFQLYVRRLDSTQFVPIKGTEDGRQPFWSPDSQHIAFFANAKLMRMAAVGGSPAVLCDASEARGGSWGTKGKIIFGLNQQSIFEVSADGGKPRLVTRLDLAAEENSHRYPLFLPDGNRFLYFARTDNLDGRAIWMATLDDQEPRRRLTICDGQFALGLNPDVLSYSLLTQQSGKVVEQTFDLDRGELVGASRVLLNRASVFSVSTTGVLVLRTNQQDLSRLVWCDRLGKRGNTLGPDADYWGVDIAPNDRLVIANRHDALNGHFRLWLATLGTGLIEPFSDTVHASNAIWSADSNSLFYGDSRQHTLLYRTLSPRSEETALLSAHAKGLFITDIANNRQFTVGEIASSNAHSEVGWMELQPGQKSGGVWHPIGGEGAFALLPRLSPDGRWLAYPSNQSGNLELYLMDFPNGVQHRRVSLSGGRMPRWRGDGKELFFLGADGYLMALPLPNSGKLDDAAPVKMFYGNLRLGSYESLYDVSSDGQRFLLIERVSQPDDSYLGMVLNWPSLLGA